MEETKKSLLSIDIDTGALAKNIVDAKAKVADLTAQLKALKGTTGENSVEAVNLAAQLKNARTEVNQGTTTIAQYNKALDSTTGYLERQKIELGLTQKQFEKLSLEQVKNADIGGKMQASADKLSKSVIGLDTSMGNTKSSIGNYENSIVSALGKTGLFGDVFTKATSTVNDFRTAAETAKSTIANLVTSFESGKTSTGTFADKSVLASQELKNLSGSAKDAGTDVKLFGTNGGIAAKGVDLMNASTETSTGLFQLLKVAIAETGIGLLIIALGTLFAYFQSTNEGAKKFQQITNAIGAVLQGVMKILAPIGKAIFDVFTEPQGAVKLMTSLFGLAILPIKTLVSTLWDLAHGEFKKAFNDIGDGVVEFAKKSQEAGQAAVQMFKDTQKAAGQASDEIKKVDFKKTINDSLEATKARQALTKAEREWSEEKIKQQGEVELLTKKLKDQDISAAERLKLGEKAKAIRESIFQNDVKYAKANEQLVEKEQALNSKKDYQAITDAKNRVQEVINAKDSEIQGIQNRDSRLESKQQLAAKAAKKLLDEAESERLSSIARTSQAIYDKYGEEISKTEDKYRKLIEKHKAYGATTTQLEVERQAELKKITDQFNKDAESNLDTLNKELADIRSKASKDEAQKQIDVLDQQTADKLKKLDDETNAIDLKIAQQVKAANDLRAQGNNQAADLLQKSIDVEIQELDTAGKIKAALIKQQADDEAKIRKVAADKSKTSHLAGDVISDQISNRPLKEFDDRQKQLDQEHDQAVAAAKAKGEDTFEIDQVYKKKTMALSKEKLQFEIDVAKGVMNLLGKNTEAYKVAFKAYQAYQAAQVVVDTSRTIMGIWSADAGIPFVGVPKAIAETAIAVGIGAKSLSDIWSAKGFATGGIYKSDGSGTVLRGPGTGTSDSINARLSHGEAIINARSTAMFAPVLSAINVAGGGRAFSLPNLSNHFATGGVFNGMSADSLGLQTQVLNNINQLLDGLPEKIGGTIAASTPKQVLVVEDVQAGLQNKTMLQNMSNF
jgi:hypothetical protein